MPTGVPVTNYLSCYGPKYTTKSIFRIGSKLLQDGVQFVNQSELAQHEGRRKHCADK